MNRDRVIGLVSLLVMGWILVGSFGPMILSRAEPVSQAATAPAESARTFRCTPTHVWDGDGPVWCAEGPRIRLSGIAARELRIERGRAVDAGCNAGHPCPAMAGPDARDVLVRLLGGARGTGPHGHVLVEGPALHCEARGTTHQRVAALCRLPDGRYLGCALIGAGAAARWDRYDPEGTLRRC